MFRRKEEMEGSAMAEDMFEAQEGNEAQEAANSTASSNSSTQAAEKEPTKEAAPAAPVKTAARPSAPVATPSFRPQSTGTAVAPSARPSAPSEVARSSSPASASKRVLTVGTEINMKGEISSCDRLLIEGQVDATLRDVHTVELAQTGSFKGTAEVEDAEISGDFDGDLTVRGRLIIYSTGQVRGSVTYGEIEIERGGRISGSINQIAEAQGAKAAKKAA